MTYIPLLVEAGISIRVSVSNRAASPSFVDLADTRDFETIWADRRVDPISIFDAHWVRTRWLRRLARDIAPGVFQSTWDSTLELDGWPEVMMVHDMIPEMTLRPRRSLFQAQVIASRKRALANAQAVIAVSDTTARDLANVYPRIARKIHVVRHGPTLGDVEPVAIDQVLSDHGVGMAPGEFYLFVGRRKGYKNFKVVRELLDISPAAVDRGLIAVGGEPSTLEERHPFISFIPYVTDSELVALYRSARALIYPSTYEGFGLPVLEAMSHGCPVVSSKADALVEVGGDASVYFDPHSTEGLVSALVSIERLDLGQHTNRMGENVARFSWAKSARQLSDLYESLA